jgi:hypothetical protein
MGFEYQGLVADRLGGASEVSTSVSSRHQAAVERCPSTRRRSSGRDRARGDLEAPGHDRTRLRRSKVVSAMSGVT